MLLFRLLPAPPARIARVAAGMNELLRGHFRLGRVRLDATLRELGLDDLDRQDLAHFIRRRLGVDFPPAQLRDTTTVASLIGRVARLSPA